jgi:hypothetical protein
MSVSSLRAFALTVVLVIGTLSSATAGEKGTDAQIKKSIIKESIASYAGRCPCPYSVARNGSSCGRRSAYSRPGGASPICYPADVTRDMVLQWRENHS